MNMYTYIYMYVWWWWDIYIYIYVYVYIYMIYIYIYDDIYIVTWYNGLIGSLWIDHPWIWPCGWPAKTDHGKSDPWKGLWQLWLRNPIRYIHGKSLKYTGAGHGILIHFDHDYHRIGWFGQSLTRNRYILMVKTMVSGEDFPNKSNPWIWCSIFDIYPLVNVYITNWKDPPFFSWKNSLFRLGHFQ